jgi:hypothetical protein
VSGKLKDLVETSVDTIANSESLNRLANITETIDTKIMGLTG